MSIRLIVGLGNPGAKYEATRHNVGFWLVDELARAGGGQFRVESKFHGEVCKLLLHGRECWLLKPGTYMNRSGQAVAALAQFYKVAPEEVLVVHDDLDLSPGSVRLKQGGGHGGHNGLRDIMAVLGSKQFLRLRIGIGHPGPGRDVSAYVLGKPPGPERDKLESAIFEVRRVEGLLLGGDLNAVMNSLHALR